MKKKLLLISLFISSFVIAQNEITWYGFDFSMCKISSPDKIFEGQNMKDKYIPGWITALNKSCTPEWFGRRLKKKKFTQSDMMSIQKMYSNIDPKNLVIAPGYSITDNEIKAEVNSYTLSQKSGIAAVMIVENINEATKEHFVTEYLVLFDAETKNIIKIIKQMGHPASKYGFSNYWKNGLENGCYKAWMSTR